MARQTVFALHGHLSRKSLRQYTVGDTFAKGDIIGWLGTQEENGGWNLRALQLSLVKPETKDLPGWSAPLIGNVHGSIIPIHGSFWDVFTSVYVFDFFPFYSDSVYPEEEPTMI